MEELGLDLDFQLIWYVFWRTLFIENILKW